MALLFLDSFDHYLTADLGEKWGTASASSIVAAAGRRSSAALRVGITAEPITRPLAPASTTAIAGVAVKLAALVATQTILTIRSGATTQVTLGVNASGFATVYRSTNAGTLLGTAVVGPVTIGAYNFFELKTTIDPSAGTAVVRINGVEVLNLSGVNTAQSGVASWDTFSLRCTNNNTDYDDLYLLDSSGAAPCNDFLGDCRVDARYPTAEGAASAWTPFSGTDNALMVDETAPDDDTTYNSTPTVGATDTHVVQDAPVPGALLYGVQLCLSVKKSDAGTCSVAPVVRHSSVDYPGTAFNPGTAYAYNITPYGTNPGTSAAWTEADFNAAEFGYKRTA
jgi:hypothetical protein